MMLEGRPGTIGVVLLILFSTLPALASEEAKVSENNVPGSDAMSYCQKHGLYSLSTIDQHLQMETLMYSLSLTEAWLPTLRDLHKHPVWPNGSKLEVDENSVPDDDRCGFFDFKDKRQEFGKCNATASALCMTVCSSCSSLGHSPRRCFHDNGTCYMLTSDADNFEHAHALCRQFGAVLAVPPSLQDDPLNLGRLSSVKEGENKAFIDLSRDRWNWTTDLTFSLWGIAEPGLSGNCALAVRESGETSWKSAPCSERHPVICFTKDKGPVDPQGNAYRARGNKQQKSVICRDQSASNAPCGATCWSSVLNLLTTLSVVMLL